MEPDAKMQVIIGKVRYCVEGSILLAHDCYWDGNNMERHGRNTYLYRSPGGRYFAVRLSQWQGERNHIEPLEQDDAYEVYEGLAEQEVSVEVAFPGVAIEDA